MIVLDGHLTLENYFNIVYKNQPFTLSESVKGKVDKSRDIVDTVVKQNKVVYGINTGFGTLANTRIASNELINLQYNLIRSHATGYGDPASFEITKGTLLLRLNSLLQGYSGLRYENCLVLAAAIKENLYIYIPQKGSLGASGDLAPLSHIVLALIGEGEIVENGVRKPSDKVLHAKNMKTMNLEAKEGLALINGTPYMTAYFLDSLIHGENIIKWADIISGFTIENLKGSLTPFLPENHKVRPHQGQVKTAEIMVSLFSKSKIIQSHKDCQKVQDAYSLRCIPQVHGAVKDVFRDCLNVVKTEMNSVTDNPLLFSEDKIYSQGNFHGEILALYADFFSMAVSELSNISERRIERLLNPSLSGLPAFLAETPGISSGLMIVQYTAAALVSENKILAHPASVDSIPVSASQEDHVSMGANAVIKLRKIIDNAYAVIAAELLADLYAKRFHKAEFAEVTTLVSSKCKSIINYNNGDHPYYREIEQIVKYISSFDSMKLIENTVFSLSFL